MNPITGELIKIVHADAGDTGKQAALAELRASGFLPVPEEHQEEAATILGSNDHAFADMTQNTPLVNWAKSYQHKNKSNRSKMAKASRCRNRR